MDVCCVYISDGEPELLAITASLDDAMMWIEKHKQYILDRVYGLEAFPESLHWIKDIYSPDRLFAYLENEDDDVDELSDVYELSIETRPVVFYTDEEA